nr:hypothetical protein [Pseudomonas sp. KU26590]
MSVTILGPLSACGEKLRLYSSHVPAGFPSPAADHIQMHIPLHMRGEEVVLKSENPNYPSRQVMEGDERVIWGVVIQRPRS